MGARRPAWIEVLRIRPCECSVSIWWVFGEFDEGVPYFFVGDVEEGSVVDASVHVQQDVCVSESLNLGLDDNGLTHSGRCRRREHRDSMCLS